MNLDLADLVAVIPPALNPAGGVFPVGSTQTGRVLGIDVRRYRKWAEHGLRLDEADDIAERLERHPSEIWSSAYYEATEAARLAALPRCAAHNCDEPVDRPGTSAIYCSKRCYQRVQQKNYRDRHEHVREADNARHRDYYVRSARAVKLKAKLRWANTPQARRDAMNDRRRQLRAERATNPATEVAA